MLSSTSTVAYGYKSSFYVSRTAGLLFIYRYGRLRLQKLYGFLKLIDNSLLTGTVAYGYRSLSLVTLEHIALLLINRYGTVTYGYGDLFLFVSKYIYLLLINRYGHVQLLKFLSISFVSFPYLFKLILKAVWQSNLKAFK